MTYDAEFYELEGKVAKESAAVVLPWLWDRYTFRYVIDVGCGTGEWVRRAIRLGGTAAGVDQYDGVFEPWFIRSDLTNGYPCRGYDLAICLEVAEHLPETSAVPLVTGLAGAKRILFSAATPGQPGVGHINCQPHDYWHDLFAEHGKTPTTIGAFFHDTAVADFYCRNMYLYE